MKVTKAILVREVTLRGDYAWDSYLNELFHLRLALLWPRKRFLEVAS